MATPWNYAGQVASIGPASAVTLVEESTFAISDPAGDMVPGGAHGLFFRDTRIVSRLELRIDGRRLESLASTSPDPFTATFVSRGFPAAGRADSTLMVVRTRYVGQGMREDLEVRNFAGEPTVCRVEVFVDADFADLFAVKEGRAAPDPDARIERQADGNGITLSYVRGATSRGAHLQFSSLGSAPPSRGPATTPPTATSPRSSPRERR